MMIAKCDVCGEDGISGNKSGCDRCDKCICTRCRRTNSYYLDGKSLGFCKDHFPKDTPVCYYGYCTAYEAKGTELVLQGRLHNVTLPCGMSRFSCDTHLLINHKCDVCVDVFKSRVLSSGLVKEELRVDDVSKIIFDYIDKFAGLWYDTISSVSK